MAQWDVCVELVVRECVWCVVRALFVLCVCFVYFCLWVHWFSLGGAARQVVALLLLSLSR